MMSGPRVDLSLFRRGWLLLPAGRSAHHFERRDDGIVARCGLRYVPTMRDRGGFVVLEPGDFPRCRRCAP